MKKAIAIFLVTCMTCMAYAQPVSKPANQRIRVSNNHHTLVYEDGKPFFWMGDTGWELFHRLTREDVETYFKTRAGQGFNVIQAVALAEMDGLRVPNAYGDLPLENNDPLKPVAAYFNHVEWVIDKAASYGLYIALLPTWGDKLFKDRWGEGPEIFNPDNAKEYGKWIGKRFKDKKNIIWVMGGYRTPRNEQDVNTWRALANGVIEGVGNPGDALMTFHPQPSATSSSSPWFHQDTWLDLNMQQTGHCRDVNVWEKISNDYRLQPAKPVVNGEPIYEDHPVCFNAKELGHTNAYDVRKAVYLSVFAGSAGVTYGCHAMWQFYDQSRVPVNGPLKTWKESLSLPAASQMKFLKALIGRIDLNQCNPAQNSLVDTLAGTNRIQAIRSKTHLLVYTAGGETVKLNTGVIKSNSVKSVAWYDPRTGREQKIMAYATSLEFIPPSKGNDHDWVLIVTMR